MPIFRKYFILNLSLFLFLSLSVFSQKELVLTDNQLKFELGNEYFSIYEDKNATLNFDQIRKQSFKYDASNSFNFGYSTSKFWIKCRIRNQTKNKWLYAILASLVDEFEFYEVMNDGSYRKRVSGDKYPHSQREEDLPVFSFLMDIPEGESRTVYLSVRSIDTKQFTIKIENENYFLVNLNRQYHFWFFYFGLLFMMVVYNLLLFFSIFDKAYLYYVLYILSFIFAQLTVLGFGTQYIWGNYVWFANRTPVFFASLTGFFALLFAYHFLNVKQYYPQAKNILYALVIANATLAILTIIKPQAWVNQGSSWLIIIEVLIVVFIGLKIVRKGYTPARYYLLSWAILFVALILFSLKMSGFLPITAINYTMLPVGAVIEVVMLSLGLGNRINTAQKEKTEAQKALVTQLLANEQVRSRIARDLHDDLGSTLSSVRILSEYAQNVATKNPRQTEDLLRKIASSTQKLQENLQDIVWTTQSKDNTLNDLTARMRRFGGEILEAKNIDFKLLIDEKVYDLNLSTNAQYDIFMIFKEAINNIVKYSMATVVTINLKYEPNELYLKIQDNGIGFDTLLEKEGNGLKNMPKRAESFGGRFMISSKPNVGTKIELNVPVSPNDGSE